MNIINKSRKIISVNGEPFLPGRTMELEAGMESNPVIVHYLEKGVIADADKAVAAGAPEGISDFERAKIAEDAIARYKAEQEAIARAQAEKKAEIEAVKSMKKDELLTKAAGMGLEVADNDKVDALKEKIIVALNQ